MKSVSKYVTIGLLGYLFGMKQKELQKTIGWNRLKKKMLRMLRLP